MLIVPRSKSQVVLPLPPSTNHLFASVRGRRIKTREYKAWVEAASVPLIELRPPRTTPVEVIATVWGKVNKQRDLDNFLKPILDLLVSQGVLPGDSIKYVTSIRIGYGGEWDAEPGVSIQFR